MRISDWSSDVCSSDLVRQCVEAGIRVFLAVFNLHGLAIGEVESVSRHVHLLVPPADQEGLDPASRLDIGCVMREAVGIKIASQLPVQAYQQVEREVRRDPVGVVIRRLDNGTRFLQVDSNQRTTPARSEEHTSELQSLMRIS